MKRSGLPRRAAPAVILSIALVVPAGAATITVDAVGDDLDLGANGNCTLREAVVAANTDAAVDACPAGSGADVIELSSGVFSFAIAGAGEDGAATGDLDVTGELTIEGLGADVSVIDAAGLDRVLHVHGVPLTLRDLTVRGGLVEDAVVARGGGILAESGALALERVELVSNRAEGLAAEQGGQAQGGGIHATGGSLVVLDSRIVANEIQGGRTQGADLFGPDVYGGGLYLAGVVVEIRRSAIHDNGGWGGASSTVFLGPGSSYGGALWSDGDVEIERSSIVGNFSYSASAVRNAGELRLENVTMADNETGVSCGTDCTFGRGQVWTDDGGATTLEHVTIGVGALFGEIVNDGETILRATIVRGNCTADELTSLGHNVTSGSACRLDDPTDVVGLEPLLRPLDRSGPIAFLAPLSSSAAVDTADAGTCPAVDVIGTARPVDGDLDGNASCDVGAFELVCEGPDSDGDGVVDLCDSCPDLADPSNLDSDGDGLGDSCDSCPLDFDPYDRDVDGDGIGDACDPCTDVDGDGYVAPNFEDGTESCPNHPLLDCRDDDPDINPGQTEIPGNGVDDDCNDATPACGPAEIGVETPVDARALASLLLVALAPLAWRARVRGAAGR